MSYLVAGCKPWNRRLFDEVISKYPGEWYFVESPHDLAERVADLDPRYIFFQHWSWRVPLEIVDAYECVCFHMTDVPYGRGGSPLQNLIVRGHRRTVVSALRMVDELDGGPVYMKEELSLEGGGEEIYIHAAYLSAEMMRHIAEEQPQPLPQTGEVTTFHRRTSRESRILEQPDLQGLHDFIRMLDADGYPRAFLEYAGFRYEFTRPALYEGRIVADVRITQV